MYNREMRVWWFAIALACAGCTKSNPAATCSEGQACTDPAFPFCDLDGVIGGVPGSCISVVCKAGDVAGCESDGALVCNATGTDYDVQTCPNGCDATTGCNACTPSSVACVNDMLTTCGSDGAVASMQPCTLGCGSDEGSGARCAQLVPSNGLQAFLDMVAAPSDLDLEAGTVDLSTGLFNGSNGSNLPMTLPLFSMDAPAGGEPVRVLVVHDLTLSDVTLSPGSGAPGVVFAVIASGDITIAGRVVLTTAGLDSSDCEGGSATEGSANGNVYVSGAGGGGFATAGGAGGSVTTIAIGPSGGVPSGNGELIPLRGGCDGGGNPGEGVPGIGGPGGGALQLTSLTAIRVLGTIDADGDVSPSLLNGHHANYSAGAGGGAGGGVLLEAPTVTLGSAARVLVRGAGGTSGGEDFGVAQDDAANQPGASCQNGDTTCLGSGGAGAAGSAMGTAGGSFNGTLPSVSQAFAGGGGGGNGRIRINTADGTFAGSAAQLTGVATTAAVSIE
jgi:hypothetical protein